MLLKVTDSGSPVVQPSTYLKNLLLNLKLHSVFRVQRVIKFIR